MSISKNSLRKQLDKLCSEYIRIRDKMTCQWCGKVVEGSNCHCSHIIPKSHGNILRYDEKNLVIHCYHCHLNVFHKNPIEGSEWFKNKFPDRYEYLMKRKEEIQKFSTEDYLCLIHYYKEKIKKHLTFKKNNGNI